MGLLRKWKIAGLKKKLVEVTAVLDKARAKGNEGEVKELTAVQVALGEKIRVLEQAEKLK